MPSILPLLNNDSSDKFVDYETGLHKEVIIEDGNMSLLTAPLLFDTNFNLIELNGDYSKNESKPIKNISILKLTSIYFQVKHNLQNLIENNRTKHTPTILYIKKELDHPLFLIHPIIKTANYNSLEIDLMIPETNGFKCFNDHISLNISLTNNNDTNNLLIGFNKTSAIERGIKKEYYFVSPVGFDLEGHIED